MGPFNWLGNPDLVLGAVIFALMWQYSGYCMVVYLAADQARLQELDSATRDYLGWDHVLRSEADLDLTQNQRNQAAQRRAQADQTVNARLLQSFTWALIPAQPDPAAPRAVICSRHSRR